LKKCFAHLKVSPIFGRHLVLMLLGFRQSWGRAMLTCY
jgi:hypothetical protein